MRVHARNHCPQYQCTMRVVWCIAMLTVIAVSVPAHAQSVAATRPDSAAEHFFLQTVSSTADSHFARTATDTGPRVL